MSDMGDGGQTAPVEAPQAPQQTDGQPQEGQQAPQNDVVMQRLDEMSQQLGRLAQTAPPEADPQFGIGDFPYQDPNQFDTNQYQDPNQFADPNQFDPQFQGYQDPQAAEQQVMQMLNQTVAQAVQEAVHPIRVEAKVRELQTQYPELNDPKVYQGVFNEAVQYANRMGDPTVARHPEVIELVYLAQQARKNAQQETPADGGNNVHLEGGGAAPSEPELDGADRMLQAWGKLPQ